MYINLILWQLREVDIIVPILEMDKMGHRKMSQPTQDHLIGGWERGGILQPF